MSMLELHQAILAIDRAEARHRRAARLFGTALIAISASLPGAPITRDQWLMLQQDNVAAKGAPGLGAFGIEPTPLAAVAAEWLGRYRGNRFALRGQCDGRLPDPPCRSC